MLIRYAEMLERYSSAYRIGRAVASGSYYKIAPGLYSDEEYPNPDAVVCTLYPQTVLTMNTAFYLHGLTDVVPEFVHVATARNTTRIRDKRVQQHFINRELMGTGIERREIDGCTARVFSRERMLVELLRQSGSLPLDYYRELITSYRRIAPMLDMQAVEDCMALYKRADSLFEMLQREVL